MNVERNKTSRQITSGVYIYVDESQRVCSVTYKLPFSTSGAVTYNLAVGGTASPTDILNPVLHSRQTCMYERRAAETCLTTNSLQIKLCFRDHFYSDIHSAHFPCIYADVTMMILLLFCTVLMFLKNIVTLGEHCHTAQIVESLCKLYQRSFLSAFFLFSFFLAQF